VVDGYGEDVIISTEAKEPCPDRPIPCEIEAFFQFLTDKPKYLGIADGCGARQIENRSLQRSWSSDPLHRDAIDGCVRGTQHFVSSHDFAERAIERGYI